MTPPARHCVLVPVFNHGLTVGRVVREARHWFPVIAVNDGSTDETADALEREPDIERVTLPVNRGKGAALEAGFEQASTLGYSHVITLDADGQHPIEALPQLAETSRAHPHAIIVGVRDLKGAGAPKARRFSNALSNFWFKVETGIALGDTQTGLRCYPLATIHQLPVQASRYAWELEILVRAAWAGVELISHEVTVDYQAPTSRLSHFHPVRDFLRISRLHSWLLLKSLFRPRRSRPPTTRQPGS